MEDQTLRISEMPKSQADTPGPNQSAAPSPDAVGKSATSDHKVSADQTIAGRAKSTVEDVPAKNEESVRQRPADDHPAEKSDLPSGDHLTPKRTVNPIVASATKGPSTKGRLPNKVLLALAELDLKGVGEFIQPTKSASLATQRKATPVHDVSQHPLNKSIFSAKLSHTLRRGIELPDEDNEYYLTGLTLGGAA